MQIAIVLGHSKLASGYYTSADGTHFGGCNEYKFNKGFAPILVRELRKRKHKVTYIACPENVFHTSSEERAYKLDQLKNNRYDLIIELHLNADTDGADGCEVLYKSHTGEVCARLIQRALANIFTDRGVKKRDSLYMLSKTQDPAIIIETFFCTNKKDYRYARMHRIKIAKAIAGALTI